MSDGIEHALRYLRARCIIKKRELRFSVQRWKEGTNAFNSKVGWFSDSILSIENTLRLDRQTVPPGRLKQRPPSFWDQLRQPITAQRPSSSVPARLPKLEYVLFSV